MPPPSRKPGSVKDMSKDRADSKKNVTQQKAKLAEEQAAKARQAWLKKAKPTLETLIKETTTLNTAFEKLSEEGRKAEAAKQEREKALKLKITTLKKDDALTPTTAAEIKTQAEKDAKEFEEERKRRESTIKGLLKGFDGSMKKLSGVVDEGTKTGVLVDPGGKLPPPPKPPGTVDVLQAALWAGALLVYLRHLLKKMK